MSVCVEDNVLEELLTLLKLEKIENIILGLIRYHGLDG